MRIISNKNIYFSERKERQCPPFSHSEWIKFAIFALIVRPKKKKLQMSKHITEEQRYAISMMLQIPMSKKAIAEAIGVDKSTVYREIKRNCDARSGSYSMELAQRKADRRKQQKHRKEVLTPAMRKRIIKLLKKGFSPEQIVGRSRLEGIAMVSHETIYRWIWEDKRRGGKLHKYLRRQGRRYAKRGSKNAGRGFIPGRVDIDERPEIVELKERFGDLEIDTIIGKNHKGAILTINDRATSRVWIRKLSGKEAIPVAKIAVWALRKVKNLIHTITADNGKEFAKHEEIAQKLEIKFYFCKPYHSWERGANENTNGLIRQYIPKGKDFSEVTNKQIKWIENKLNNRPRKRLGYLTPNEKFKQIINQNSVAFASWIQLGKWKKTSGDAVATHVTYKNDGTFEYTSTEDSSYKEVGKYKIDGNKLYEMYSDEEEWIINDILLLNSMTLSVQELEADGVTPTGQKYSYQRVE